MASYMILRNSNGNRYVLYLYWNDGQWQWNYNWLDNDWNDNHSSAVLATLFISLPPFDCLGEFCLELSLPATEHAVHFPDHRVLRTVTKRQMFRRVRETEEQEETITSYLGMLSHGNGWKSQARLKEARETAMLL